MMSKDTFYFPHDYNPRSDEKVIMLVRKHGMLGYGVYWAIIELLYNNANALRTDYDGIAYDLRTDSKIIESVICDFGLFVVNDGYFGSQSVSRRMDERNEKSEKARISATYRWMKPDENANAMRLQSDRNAIKERIGKEIKEIKEKKIKKAVISFEKVPNNFLTVLEVWLRYKAGRKEDYKSQISFDAMISKLVRESGNNPGVALQMIENAMANNWQGFFPINEQRQRSFNHTPVVTAEIDELTAEYNAGRITEEEYLKRKA